MQIIQLGVRAAQLIFAAIVLGLSISLAKGQTDGSVPAMTIYAIVCGIAGLVAGLLGLAAIFWHDLSGFITLIVDGICTLILLAGSIAMAAILGVGSCSGDNGYPSRYCLTHPIIAGGAIDGDINDPDSKITMDTSWFESRCHMAQADVAFLFFTLVTLVVAAFFSFRESGGRRKGGAVV